MKNHSKHFAQIISINSYVIFLQSWPFSFSLSALFILDLAPAAGSLGDVEELQKYQRQAPIITSPAPDKEDRGGHAQGSLPVTSESATASLSVIASTSCFSFYRSPLYLTRAVYKQIGYIKLKDHHDFQWWAPFVHLSGPERNQWWRTRRPGQDHTGLAPQLSIVSLY